MSTRYQTFHDTTPDAVLEGKIWVPGELELLGSCIDCGYSVQHESSKEGHYVHDHKDGVKIYRRARAGGRVDLNMRSFPREAVVLGKFLGATWRDAGGKTHEIKGAGYLTAPTTRMLAVVKQGSGVEYVIKGGSMRVDDWIYD